MEYKETSIGKIPSDWTVSKIRELFDFKRGYSYRKSEMADDVTKNRFLTINDIKKEGGIKKNAVKIYLKEDVKINSDFRLKRDDLLIANTDMTKGFIIGAPIIIENSESNSVFSMDLTKLLPKKQLESKYLFYSLKSYQMRQKMKIMAQGTNVKHLNHQLVKNVMIPIPPIQEQEKIAEIISTTDEAIQKSDVIIGRTEQLKRGIMHKLLAEGIGHDEFMDSDIGRLPADWGVKRLGNITKVTVGHVGPISQYYTKSNEGIPLVSTTNISDNGMDIKNLKFVSKEFDEKHQKSKVFSQDLIIARHGASGSASLVPTKLNEAQSLNVVIVRASKNFNSKYLEYLFNYGLVKTRLAGWKSGSVQGVVNTRVLEKFKIPIPTLIEQDKIASIASSIDNKYQIELKRNKKLKNIKRGLMNDLLTGNRRVQVNN